MAKFNVLKPIVFDGKPREPGDTIEASQAQMEHPLVKGYVEPGEAGGEG